jgi:hypothetical protein
MARPHKPHPIRPIETEPLPEATSNASSSSISVELDAQYRGRSGGLQESSRTASRNDGLHARGERAVMVGAPNSPAAPERR